jgi:hypothetical protein
VSFLSQRQKLLEILGFFWTDVFLGQEFLDGFTTSLAVPFNDLANQYARLPDYLSRYTVPLKELHEIWIFQFDEEDEIRDEHRFGDAGLVYGGGAFYGSQVVRTDAFKYPFDDAFEPAFLCTSIVDPPAILRRGEDYEIENGVITFFKNPLSLESITKLNRPVNGENFFRFLFYGFKVEEDIRGVQDFFGAVAGVVGDTSLLYKDAVNVAWDLRVEGATDKNIIRMLSVLSRTSYVKEGGTVRDVFIEGDQRVVLTDTAVYVAPVASTALVVRGDVLEEGQIIFDSFSIKRAREQIDFADFEALVIGRGFVDNRFGQSLLFVNDTVPMERQIHPEAQTVKANPEGPGFIVFNSANKVVGFVETEAEAVAILDASPPDLYVFYVGGTAEGVDAFMLQLNEPGTTPTFFDALQTKYGRIPALINPFEEMKDLYFRHNSFFIKLRDPGIVPGKLLSQLFTVLRKTIHAGSTFFLLLEKQVIGDEFGLDKIFESVEVFHAIDVEEDEYSAIREHILKSPVA